MLDLKNRKIMGRILNLNFNQNSGFSIVEAIISIFVVGVILAIYGQLSEMVAVNKGTGYQEIALRIARSQAEDLRALPFSALPASGSFSHTLLAELPQGSANFTNADFGASEVKKITIVVSWQEARAGNRNITLTTLISQGGL